MLIECASPYWLIKTSDSIEEPFNAFPVLPCLFIGNSSLFFDSALLCLDNFQDFRQDVERGEALDNSFGIFQRDLPVLLNLTALLANAFNELHRVKRRIDQAQSFDLALDSMDFAKIALEV